MPSLRKEYGGEVWLQCPKCGHADRLTSWTSLTLPAGYAGVLERVYKCAVCRFIFAPATPDRVSEDDRRHDPVNETVAATARSRR